MGLIFLVKSGQFEKNYLIQCFPKTCSVQTYLSSSSLKAQNCPENKTFSLMVPHSHITSSLHRAHLAFFPAGFSSSKRDQLPPSPPLCCKVLIHYLFPLHAFFNQFLSTGSFPISLKSFPVTTLEGQGCHVAQLYEAPLTS